MAQEQRKHMVAERDAVKNSVKIREKNIIEFVLDVQKCSKQQGSSFGQE